MSEQDHGERPDWDAELEELVNDVEVEADSASTDASAEDSSGEPSGKADLDLVELLNERTADLQRLQAEYINYKRRVDRDRDQARQRGIEAVLVDLLPVLDGIAAAEAHGELTSGAKMMADEIAKLAAKHGLVGFGQEGDVFDPHIHDALMRIDRPGYPVASVAQVFQRGYSIGDRVIRPARVGVADADEDRADSAPARSSEVEESIDGRSGKPAGEGRKDGVDGRGPEPVGGPSDAGPDGPATSVPADQKNGEQPETGNEGAAQ